MKRICKVVLFVIAVLLVIGLCGCAKEKPAYHEVADNGVEIINAIEQGLPAECKTESNKMLFDVARKEMRNVEHSCDLQVEKIEVEKLKWKWGFVGLVILIGIYIIRKVLK